MKRSTLFTLVFFILACVKLYAQPYGWFTQQSGTGNNLNGVYFASNTTGIVVGQSGTILRTTNGGTNWISVSSGTSVHLFAVYFINGNTGWVVGDVGVILRTTNGGSSWNSYSTGLTTNLTSVSFADASNGFAAGQFGKIIRTTNGGVNWVQISSGTTAQIEKVNFTAINEAVIIGEGGFIRKSTNLGNSWNTQSSGTSNWLMANSVKNQNFYVIVGDYGTVRKTSNGGVNWYSQVSNTSSMLSAVSFVDTNTGWAVGINGTIIKTTTGGWLLPGAASLTAPANGATCFSTTGTLDWSDVFPPICNYRLQIATDQNFTNIIYNVAGINNSQYVMPPGVLLYNTQYYWRVKATNQVGESASWSSVRNFRTAVPEVYAPNLLLPANNSTVIITPLLQWDTIAIASSYRVRIATDTGFTNLVLDSNNIINRRITVPAGRLLPNVRYYWKVLSSNVCMSSPYSARWSFTTAITGLLQNETGLPEKFMLYNNYPNPFNPSTLISFDIPKASNVRLTIFNLLGEELSLAVNEELQPGRYSYQWNASEFASGLYIYRIEAVGKNGEKFIQTHKMVLVK